MINIDDSRGEYSSLGKEAEGGRGGRGGGKGEYGRRRSLIVFVSLLRTPFSHRSIPNKAGVGPKLLKF